MPARNQRQRSESKAHRTLLCCSLFVFEYLLSASEEEKFDFSSCFSTEDEMGGVSGKKQDPELSHSLSSFLLAGLQKLSSHSRLYFEQPSIVPGPQTGTSWPIRMQP